MHRRPPLRSVSLATLVSIFSQENQYKVIKCHHIHKTNIPRYWERCTPARPHQPGHCAAPPPLTPTHLRRYVAGEDILEISADVDFPPCLLARRMLEQMLRLSKQVRAPGGRSAGRWPVHRRCAGLAG
jgi:hypothetical protein